jgi:hypothetical protein
MEGKGREAATVLTPATQTFNLSGVEVSIFLILSMSQPEFLSGGCLTKLLVLVSEEWNLVCNGVPPHQFKWCF